MTVRLGALMAFQRRVLIVEDDGFVRGLMTQVLTAADFDVRAASDVVEATTAFGAFDPDAVIVDIHLGPGPTGLELAQSLKVKSPGLAVLAVSNYPTAASAGISDQMPDDAAFVCKSALSTPGALIEALEASLTNSASSLRALQQQDSPLGQLTATQIDILRLIALGWSNAEIAEQRGSTQRSVEQMVHKIFRALGVKDDPRKNARVEAVKLYAEVFGIPAAAE